MYAVGVPGRGVADMDATYFKLTPLMKYGCALPSVPNRVVAYILDGIRCGLPGVGESEEERLTFQIFWLVCEALIAGEWVRFITLRDLGHASRI